MQGSLSVFYLLSCFIRITFMQKQCSVGSIDKIHVQLVCELVF